MQRRNLIKHLGAAAILGVLPKKQLFAENNEIKIPSKKVLRIAHITDVHLQHNDGAPKLFEECLHHLQSQDPKPDIIFNGGDTIDDALLHTKSHILSQWNLWNRITKNECNLKIEHCIGNHDVWGLLTEKADPLYGKKFALSMMELEKTYRSFDMNGWHFIILDSTHERLNGIWYTAKLGNEQMEWLRNDLENTNSNTPIMILSHIPIISACALFDKAKNQFGKIKLHTSIMHGDYKKIVELFSQYQNIKICVSGHTHLSDHVTYNGISFYCNGAVSGDWWKNEYVQNTKAGYALIDLFEDGSHTNQYLSYR